MKTESLKSKNRILAIPALLIAVLGFFIYANSLEGKFIWDDRYLIKENVYVKNPSRLPELFTESIGHGAGIRSNSYRPFQMLTYMAEYSLWKLDVRGYHFTNIIIHILAGLAFYWVANILFGNKTLSFLAGVLFVTHPVHTEAVSYISGRADPLATAFILLSLALYAKNIESGKTAFYLLALLSYVLALFSRENSLILPAFFILYHYVFRKKLNVINFLPFMAVSLAYIFLRVAVIKAPLPHAEETTTALERLPSFFAAVTVYIRLLFFPFGLHMEYGKRLFNIANPSVLSGVTASLILLIYAFRKGRNALLSFSILWFFLALAPISNIYPLAAYMAEHWLYLPSLGFFLVLAGGINYLYEKFKGYRIFTIGFVIFLVAFYSYLTIKQNVYWKEPIAFYKRTLKHAPDSFRVHNDLGIEYYDMGKKEEAIASFERAIKLDPDPARAYNNLGVIYKELGRKTEALEAFKKAIEFDPELAEAYNNLGVAYEERGEKGKAIEAYKKAMELGQNPAEAYSNLGNIYASQARYKEAITLYEKAISINPQYGNTYNNLGNVYKNTGKYREAIELYKKALSLNAKPLSAVHNNLALARFLNKDYGLAVEHYDRAIELGHQPDSGFLKQLEPYRK